MKTISFRQWAENRDNYNAKDLHSDEEIIDMLRNRDEDIDLGYRDLEITPDTYYYGGKGNAQAFYYDPEKDETFVSSYAGTHSSFFPTPNSYYHLLGRIGYHFNQEILPIISFWKGSAAAKENLVRDAIKSLKNYNGDPQLEFPVKDLSPVYANYRLFGTVGEILQGGGEFKTMPSLKMITYDGRNTDTGEILRLFHTLPKGSEEFNKLKQWVCANMEKYTMLRSLKGRIRCTEPKKEPDGFSVLKFKKWLAQNPQATGRDIDIMMRYHQVA